MLDRIVLGYLQFKLLNLYQIFLSNITSFPLKDFYCFFRIYWISILNIFISILWWPTQYLNLNLIGGRCRNCLRENASEQLKSKHLGDRNFYAALRFGVCQLNSGFQCYGWSGWRIISSLSIFSEVFSPEKESKPTC